MPRTTLLISFLGLTLLSRPTIAQADPGNLGVMADIGVPDGAMASLVYRPLSMLSVHGGVGYNLIAPGVRAGVTLRPVSWMIAPTFTLEAGRYLHGDANQAATMFGISTEQDGSPILREVGYDFANFHLGIELGSSRFSFYLHAGWSGIRGEVRNLQEQIQSDQMSTDPNRPTIEVRKDPIINLWIPSARSGLIFFF